jgi:hypothetical protein
MSGMQSNQLVRLFYIYLYLGPCAVSPCYRVCTWPDISRITPGESRITPGESRITPGESRITPDECHINLVNAVSPPAHACHLATIQATATLISSDNINEPAVMKPC